MKKTIVCTQGIPASGKSTWAKKFCEENQGWMRVNKDDIRKGLSIDYGPDGGKYSKKLENQVIDAERTAVTGLAIAGYNIIVDNTHLLLRRGNTNKHLEFYRSLAKENGMNFEIKTFFISEEEAIERDSKREGSERVGPEVFQRMKKYSKFPNEFPDNPTFRKYDEGKTEVVLVDLDGTLAFMDGKRSPYDGSKVAGDRINNHLDSMLSMLNAMGLEIIFLSGRGAEYREETQDWLLAHNWGSQRLLMRGIGDTRKDTIVKQEIWENEIRDNHNVFAVFDDRDCVVAMWRKLNLPVYDVWYGNF